MNWIQPIGEVRQDGSLKKIAPIPHARIRRETDEEAAERRRRDAEEHEAEWRRNATGDSKPVPAEPGKPIIVAAEDAPDGHAHVDVRV